MAVSKHNQWKRQKNGLMKLVRSHGEWLEKRRERKMRELSRKREENTPIESSQWWDKSTRTKPVASGVETHAHGSSTKRTQVGKKI